MARGNYKNLSNKPYIMVVDSLDFTAAEPAVPVKNTFYWNTTAGNSSVTAQALSANTVVKWMGASWQEDTPETGTFIYNQTTTSSFVWDGSVLGSAGGGSFTITHLTNTAVSPAITGLPTFAELQAAVTAATLTNTVAYYNTSDVANTDTAQIIVYVDETGSIIKIENPELIDLVINANEWGQTNVSEPIQVDTSSRKALRLTDADGANAGYYTIQSSVPNTIDNTVRIVLPINGSATNAVALQVTDFAGTNTATVEISPVDGATNITNTGSATAPSVVSSIVKGNVIDLVITFPFDASFLTYRLYPAYSAIASLGTQDGALTGSVDIIDIDFDYIFVNPSFVATRIDSSAAVVTETLAASLDAGNVRLFTNIDLTNTATLAVQTGETLNGVTDATFLFSNYAVGTQFRVDEVTGGWVVSVVGASTTLERNTVVLPSTTVTSSSHTLTYTGGAAATTQLDIASVTYYDEGSRRYAQIKLSSSQDAEVNLAFSTDLIPVGGTISEMTAYHDGTVENVGTQSPSLIKIANNEVILNRDNTWDGAENQVINLVIDGAATGQTVLAGALEVGNLTNQEVFVNGQTSLGATSGDADPAALTLTVAKSGRYVLGYEAALRGINLGANAQYISTSYIKIDGVKDEDLDNFLTIINSTGGLDPSQKVSGSKTINLTAGQVIQLGVNLATSFPQSPALFDSKIYIREVGKTVINKTDAIVPTGYEVQLIEGTFTGIAASPTSVDIAYTPPTGKKVASYSLISDNNGDPQFVDSNRGATGSSILSMVWQENLNNFNIQVGTSHNNRDYRILIHLVNQ